ncbi:hypothetical protein HDU76_009518, partial [Blyttiomyces sp. JEL0837]
AAHSRKPSNVPISQLPALLTTNDPVPFTTANVTKQCIVRSNAYSRLSASPLLLSSLVTPPSPSEARPLPSMFKKGGNVDDRAIKLVQAPPVAHVNTKKSPLWAVWDWSGVGRRSTDGN